MTDIETLMQAKLSALDKKFKAQTKEFEQLKRKVELLEKSLRKRNG